jgi:hypothetical protein
MKYLVKYDWELPGWDEFNRSLTDASVVEAESIELAESKFKELNKGKRIYIYNIIKL